MDATLAHQTASANSLQKLWRELPFLLLSSHMSNREGTTAPTSSDLVCTHDSVHIRCLRRLHLEHEEYVVTSRTLLAEQAPIRAARLSVNKRTPRSAAQQTAVERSRQAFAPHHRKSATTSLVNSKMQA
jgi:hypothetical protein